MKKNPPFKIGIGTDIEQIDRFRKLDAEQNKLFLEKIFTDSEIKHCLSKKDFAHHLAARFSGKEAVIKALYDLGKENINFKDVEIINQKSGIPIVKILGQEELYIKLSLSHCDDRSLAFACAIEGVSNE